MDQSKLLRPEWLPAVALSSALAVLMLAWSPPVGDLAAFAATLVERFGAVFERAPRTASPAELGLDLPAATLEASR